jgi:hypothetical protein
MTSLRNIMEAIHSLNPNAEVHAKSIDDITWGVGDVISKSDIETEIIRLQAEYDAQLYARARKAEYDALNQFELISDDSANNTTTHVDAIAAIKLKHPKS